MTQLSYSRRGVGEWGQSLLIEIQHTQTASIVKPMRLSSTLAGGIMQINSAECQHHPHQVTKSSFESTRDRHHYLSIIVSIIVSNLFVPYYLFSLSLSLSVSFFPHLCCIQAPGPNATPLNQLMLHLTCPNQSVHSTPCQHWYVPILSSPPH